MIFNTYEVQHSNDQEQLARRHQHPSLDLSKGVCYIRDPNHTAWRDHCQSPRVRLLHLVESTVHLPRLRNLYLTIPTVLFHLPHRRQSLNFQCSRRILSTRVPHLLATKLQENKNLTSKQRDKYNRQRCRPLIQLNQRLCPLQIYHAKVGAVCPLSFPQND